MLATPGTLLDMAAASRQTPSVLFMVIETFNDGDPAPIGERFARQGRMLPESVSYEASWVDTVGGLPGDEGSRQGDPGCMDCPLE